MNTRSGVSACSLRGAIAVLWVGAAGCGAEAIGVSVDARAEVWQPETVVTKTGAVFLRKDLWSAEELERIARPPEGASQVEMLAWGLRVHMRNANGAEYIEAEPNYELAERILSGEKPVSEQRALTTRSPSPETVKTKNIYGSTDDRVNISSTSGTLQAGIAFFENACTGTQIGTDTLLTAAHCVYYTESATGSGDGWICADGTVAPCGTGVGWPRFRFGVNDTSGWSNWANANCATVNITTSFMALDPPENEVDWWQFAGYDHAVLDLSACAESTWPNGIVSYQTEIAGNTFLLNLDPAYSPQYAARQPCSTGDKGQVSFASTDCPGTGASPGSTYQYNSVSWPLTGAELLLNDTGVVSAGDYNSSNTIRSRADVTDGASGGPLYYCDGTCGASTRTLLGVLSNADTDEARYSRWNSSLHNWVATYSPFPDD